MKKTIFFTVAAFAIIATFLVGCEGQNSLSTPSNFKAYQEENTIVLSWNEVSGASYYEINKNGSYWQSTSETSIVDKSPREGINSYELIASDGDKQSKPAKASCDFESSNPGGGGGGEQTSTDFYIKHPWGTGEDADWSWEPMKKSGNSYTYTGLWGGVGANINTSADDSGAEWYSESEISGASSLSIGDMVTFTFISSNGAIGSLSVTINGGGGDNPGGGEQGTTEFYIKHPWGDGSDASWSWVPMTKSGNKYTYTGLWGGVGANINTSADDSGAEWYAVSSISGASSLSIGDKVTFTFTSSNGPIGSLSVSTNGGGAGGGGGSASKPNTPSGVKATAGSSYITVTWNSVSGAENYNVYRSTSASGTYSFVSTAYSTTYTDYNVNAGTTYYYKVTAENSAGESSKSSYASAKIASSGGGDNPGGGGGTTSKPNTPSGLTATAGDSYISLSWNSVSGATSYYVLRNNTASGTYSYLDEVYSTSYTDYNVTTGTTYYYKVCAVNSAGQSAQSSYVSATINSGGGSQGGGNSQNNAPCNPTVTCKAGLTETVSVSWKASTGSGCGTPTSYTIKRYNPLNGANEIIKTNYTATYLTDSEPFPGSNTYMVIANNNYGSSDAAYGYATVEMDAPDIYSIFGNGDQMNIAVKRPKMPEEREGYYYLEFQSSASYSGTYESEGEFNFYEGETSHETIGSNTIDHYVIYFTPSYAGQTRYFKFRWVFKGGGINEKGKFTTPRSVSF